jgi:uncharacterized protein DUF6297
VLDRDQSKAMLAELRALRRKRHVQELDWVDTLYRAYVLLVLALVAVLVLSAVIGDTKVTADTVHDVKRNGIALVGLVYAVIIAGALRSGSRGGPHTVQAPDVHHLLLAPIDRDLVLRGPALRQLRVVVLTGVAVGAIGGNLAFRRLPGEPIWWVLCGAAFGACAALGAWGAAAIASGRRLTRPVASLVGVAFIAWAALDVAAHVTTAPTSWVAAIALLPLHAQFIAAFGPVVTIAATVGGLATIGGISIDAMLRRANLVGQLRFAATVQDLRVVILLHRQLALEQPRRRPWLRHRARGKWLPVWRRDWSAILRWPTGRVARVMGLSAIAIVSAIGAWLGTTPLVVVAGIASFVAALDVTEGLAQEIDHPTIADMTPANTGYLYLRHLAAPAAVLGGIAAAPVVALVALGHDSVTVEVALYTAITAAVGACAGSALSITLGPPNFASQSLMLFPEQIGVLMLARQMLAPVLAIAGFLPLALAVHAAHNGQPIVDAASATVGPIVILCGIAIGYIGSRRTKRF